MKYRPLSSELQSKARYELNEVSNLITQYVKRLRKWIKHQPHLNYKTEEQWLLTFLRCCKFNIEKTKEKLESFYTTRSLLPIYFHNRNPYQAKFQKILSLGICLPLLKTVEKDSPRIILYRCQGLDLDSNISFEDVVKTCWMINDILLNEDDNFIIGGNIAVFDVKDLPVNYFHEISRDATRSTLSSLQHAYPTKSKGLYLINTSFETEIIFNVLKSMLTRKFQLMVNIIAESNLENLFRCVPSNVIPTDYGGTGDSINYLTAYWKSKIESYQDWFIEDSKFFAIDSSETMTL